MVLGKIEWLKRVVMSQLLKADEDHAQLRLGPVAEESVPLLDGFLEKMLAMLNGGLHPKIKVFGEVVHEEGNNSFVIFELGKLDVVNREIGVGALMTIMVLSDAEGIHWSGGS